MNNIRKARTKAGISQKEIALTLGVAQPTVSIWESGEQNPTAKNLLQLSKMLSCSVDYLLGIYEPPPSENVLRIPVLGRIPAGIPIEAIEDILDYEEVPPDWGKCGREYFALKIKGDSMFPEYVDGEIVIFQVADTCESGDECAVLINGEDATFKKVIKQPSGIFLQPINTAKYTPIFYSNDDIECLPVRVIGIAVESRRPRGRFRKGAF
jgi:repressor LexA